MQKRNCTHLNHCGNFHFPESNALARPVEGRRMLTLAAHTKGASKTSSITHASTFGRPRVNKCEHKKTTASEFHAEGPAAPLLERETPSAGNGPPCGAHRVARACVHFGFHNTTTEGKELSGGSTRWPARKLKDGWRVKGAAQ